MQINSDSHKMYIYHSEILTFEYLRQWKFLKQVREAPPF